MKPKKSQIIPEFIIISSIVMGVMLLVFVIAAQKSEDSIGSRRYLEAKSVADEVSLAINQVHIGGPETRRLLWVPEQLQSGIDFDLYVISNSRVVRIEWASTRGMQMYDSQLLSSKVNTSLLNNTAKFPKINGGQIRVHNRGGGVMLEPL